MPKKLVPIEVTIKRGSDGKNEYPDFNSIESDIRDGMDWSVYFDVIGIGWHYSNEGFGEGDDVDSWIGCTCVPKKFAKKAAKMFPDTVKIISEDDFEDFYDNDAHLEDDVEFVDKDKLEEIKVRKELETLGEAPAPSAEIVAARKERLDPRSKKRGVRKNMRKKWKDARGDMKVSVDSEVKTKVPKSF